MKISTFAFVLALIPACTFAQDMPDARAEVHKIAQRVRAAEDRQDATELPARDVLPRMASTIDATTVSGDSW
jgi:hypothetical protein